MRFGRPHRFTFLELIVVLCLLVGVAALTVPQMAGFFRGRQLDDEARRLWALSRYAQAEAVARAVPVELWADPAERQYGVQAVTGFGFAFPPLNYQLSEELDLAAELADTRKTTAAKAPERLSLIWWPDGSADAANAPAWILSSRRNPADAWRLGRQAPLPTYALTRENQP